jgi:hypothetical protein
MTAPSRFQVDHPDVHYWLVTHSETSAYARNLLQRVYDKGWLTAAQHARTKHMIERERLRYRRWERRGRRMTVDDIKAMIRNHDP